MFGPVSARAVLRVAHWQSLVHGLAKRIGLFAYGRLPFADKMRKYCALAMGNHCLLVFAGESNHSRVSRVVQDFVHPQCVQ